MGRVMDVRGNRNTRSAGHLGRSSFWVSQLILSLFISGVFVGVEQQHHIIVERLFRERERDEETVIISH